MWLNITGLVIGVIIFMIARKTKKIKNDKTIYYFLSFIVIAVNIVSIVVRLLNAT